VKGTGYAVLDRDTVVAVNRVVAIIDHDANGWGGDGPGKTVVVTADGGRVVVGLARETVVRRVEEGVLTNKRSVQR
jgi:hypothetical protein